MMIPRITISGFPNRHPWSSDYPRPVSAASNSAATKFVQQYASAICSALNTIGNADGMHILMKICQSLDP